MANEDDIPATKDDLAQLRAEFRGDMDQLRNELTEAIRHTETEVLRTFHTWARTIEIRLRSLDYMQQRLGLLEERVSLIERGDISHRFFHALRGR